MWSSYGVKLKCPKCRETFSIQTLYFQDKKSVFCPCCDFDFPSEVIENLKLSIKHAALAIEYVNSNNLSGLEFDFLS